MIFRTGSVLIVESIDDDELNEIYLFLNQCSKKNMVIFVV